MKAAIYARVSTTDQNCELQIRELHDYAERQGWAIIETYQDIMSGARDASVVPEPQSFGTGEIVSRNRAFRE